MARNLPVVAQMRKRIRRKPKTLVKKVARLSRTVNRLRPELKHNDAINQTGTVNNSGLATTRIEVGPGLTQGTQDFGQRIGDEITMKNIFVNGFFQADAATTGNIYRITAFVVKQNPSGATAFNTIWPQYIAGSDNSVWMPVHLKNWDNRHAFRTIFDKIYVSNQEAPTVTQKIIPFRFNIPLKGMRMQFYNNSTTVSKNAIYIVFQSMTDDLADVFFNSRYTYTDA